MPHSACLPADAAGPRSFCIENRTETRLFFAVRAKGEEGRGLLLRQWLDGQTRVCPALAHRARRWEIFVFADADSIEGCDDEIVADGTLALKSFIEFDNCVWAKR